MKKSIFILFLFLFAFLDGCKKPDHDIKMYGYFYDVNTGTRLPNGRFNFTINFNDRFSGSSDRGGYYQGTTDANGYYELIVRDADRRKEVYKFYDGDFFMDSVGVTSFNISPDFSERKEMNMDIGLKWQVSLRITFHNVNPYDNNDVITNLSFEDPANNSYQLNNSSYTGQVVNNTMGILSYTGRQILHSTITKNNITTQRTDTIIVNPLARTYYNLNY
jgi:hypothetical protein